MVAEVYKLLHSAVEYGPVFLRALVEMRGLRSRVPQELRVIPWVTEVMLLTSPLLPQKRSTFPVHNIRFHLPPFTLQPPTTQI